jgi:hypothetical protein
MSSSVTDIPARGGSITAVPSLPDPERKGLTKKEISADHPTWCPGCGDFSVCRAIVAALARLHILGG